MEGLLGAYGSDDDDDACGITEERRPRNGADAVGAGVGEKRGELREEHAAADERGKADAADEDGEGDDNDDDDDDSDEEEDDDDERGSPQRHRTRRPTEPTVRAGAGSSSLPSALDLFESTEAPSFLSVPKAAPLDDDTALPAVKTKRPQQHQQGQVGPSKKSKGEGGRPPPNKLPSAAELEALAKELKGGRKNKEKDRASAKDKVKNQRLSGQAGIGDDFRVWRTDQEMAMRQQFD